MPRVPRWLSRSLAVLACLALPLALLSTWVSALVSDTDQYVATVGPLADEPVVRDAATRHLQRVALDAIDLDAQRARLDRLIDDRELNRLLEVGAAALADLARQAAEQAVRDVVRRVVASEEFAIAWQEANRTAHEELVLVLRGDKDGLVDDEQVSIQLATILNTVFAVLDSRGVVDRERLPEVDASFTMVKAADLEKARAAYDLLNTLGFWLPLLWGVLAAATLALARDRRGALGWLAWGSLAALLALAFGLRLLQRYAVQAVPSPDDRAVVDAVVGQVLQDLRASLVVALAVSTLVLLVRWVSGPSTTVVRVRTAVTTIAMALRTRTDPAVARGFAAVGILVVVLWWAL